MKKGVLLVLKGCLVAAVVQGGLLWAPSSAAAQRPLPGREGLFDRLPGERGFVYPPPGWRIFDNQNPSAVSYIEDGDRAVFQVMTFPGDVYSSSKQIQEEVFHALSLNTVESSVFLYNGRKAVLANAVFQQKNREQQGVFFFLDTPVRDYYITALSLKKFYPELEAELLSFLDSFGENRAALSRPGPVSQFYHPLEEGAPGSLSSFDLPDDLRCRIPLDMSDGEACQVVIEREARIMMQYPEAPPRGAWSRYYHLIMRDVYPRVEPLGAALAKEMEASSPYERAAYLLRWVQGFEYVREKDSLSDLLSPLSAAILKRGDCDARALLLLALLRYQGIEGILMVSSVFSHALAGVDVPGGGARFMGRLVLETTAEVDPGQVNRDHADPSKWMGIEFPFLSLE